VCLIRYTLNAAANIERFFSFIKQKRDYFYFFFGYN
jgi:hypothetical protein